jgi:hypothetical protein
MSSKDTLESRLHSRWKPRRPAERVARTLFGIAEPERSSWEVVPIWRWLAPATVVSLVAFVSLGMLRTDQPTAAMVHTSLGGSNLLPNSVGIRASQTRHNNFAAQRFESTSSTLFHSSIASPTWLGTNNLKR